MRNAIDKYGEPSPLYGFLQYRRRKVILRYMPEGMSRLIQGQTSSRPSILAILTILCLSPKQCPIPIRHRQVHPK